jgi:hypothetical protein
MKPIKYRGYELVPVFRYSTDPIKLGVYYDWEIFYSDSEKGTMLPYKTLEEAKEYVNDLIED